MKISESPAFQASRKYSGASYGLAFWQFGHTLLLYAVAIALMFASLSIHYGLTLGLSLIATVAYLRLFMIGHDCGHWSYLPKKWQNNLVGEFIGVLTNTPLRYWAIQHARHHRTTGNLDKRGDGDVITMTVAEYESAGWSERVWYRTYRHPCVLFLVLAPLHFVVLQRFPLGAQMRTLRGWISVMGTNIGICIYYGALIATFGLVPFLLVYGPVVMLSSLGAVWLFYVQHQFGGAYWERSDTWDYLTASLQGSSFYDLPHWLHWASGNIGYHHIHHMDPSVPNYRLPTCYANSPVLQQARSLSIRESLGTAWLALWDEEARRLISFADYDNRQPASP